jgi:hypothetical protein
MNSTTKTYRLLSNDLVYTPGIIRMVQHQYQFNPKWAIDLLHKAYALPKAIAKGVASKSIKHDVDGDTVIITVN